MFWKYSHQHERNALLRFAPSSCYLSRPIRSPSFFTLDNKEHLLPKVPSTLNVPGGFTRDGHKLNKNKANSSLGHIQKNTKKVFPLLFKGRSTFLLLEWPNEDSESSGFYIEAVNGGTAC